LPTITGECSAAITSAPTATDNCKGAIVGTTNDPISFTAQGTYSVTWTYDDGNGNTSSQTQTVIVDDITDPTITASANVSVANATGACSAEVTLAAPTTGDNCGVESVTNDHASTTYPVGTTTVTWTVTDAGGNTATATQTVTVINAAPVINSITPSTVSPVAISTGVSVTVNYTDNNVNTGKVNWDDGLGDQTISTSVANPFTLNHTYTTPGVYTVTITLTDACGSTGSSKYDYIVVYDPNGGFVTGGGWINSPEGAYPADVLLSGKATFGFVAKYKKGTNLVDGNTEFQFHAGNFKFNSTTNDAGTLVISGAKASYRGVGTVNGTGNYGYLVSAIDGQITGGGGTDKFRIKIWDKNNGNAVVYDNQMSAAENADASTLIAGGSIVIHEVKKANAKIIEIPAEPVPFNVIAYPNPAKYQFTLVVQGDSKEKVDIMVYDALGRTVKHIESNDVQSIQFGEELPTGAYFTIVSQGANQKTVRLIKE
jgi:PKD repeat protein